MLEISPHIEQAIILQAKQQGFTVNLAYQGQNISKKLLLNALQNIKKISLITGVSFAMIEAKDTQLANYYQRLGFIKIENSLVLLFPINQI